jgi:DNA-binding NarL/FixJ family response regulator
MADAGEFAIVWSERHPNSQEKMMNKKIRILIVDDSLSFRMGLRALLEIQPDMQEVGMAPSGYKAIELVEELQPDLVLLDAQMPDLTGIEVTQKIKSRWPKVKVILMTMYSDFRLKAIEAGADTFITKGIPPEHILSLIRGIMRMEKKKDGKE